MEWKKEDFYFNTCHTDNYNVKYILYRDDVPTKKTSISTPLKEYNCSNIKEALQTLPKNWHYAYNFTNVCFSQLLREITKTPNVNRLFYAFKNREYLTKGQKLRWVQLAKQHGLLPNYCNVKDIATRHNITLDLSKHSAGMLYTYLSIARYMDEDPNIVLNTLVYVDKYKLHYIAAIILASKICLRGWGHCFFQPDNVYASKDPHQSLKLNTFLGLARFIRTNKNSPKPEFSEFSFNATNTVKALSKVQTVLKFEELLDTEVMDCLASTDTDDDAHKFIKKAWGK